MASIDFFRILWNSSLKEIALRLRNKYVPMLGMPPGEWARLERLPRYQPGETVLFGQSIRFVDAASYLFMCREIFHDGIYRFHFAGAATPRIVDCGANIGLSVVFFKRLCPEATVTAFEPDPDVFAALTTNVEAFRLQGVRLLQKGIWIHDGHLPFAVEGADGGRLAEERTGGTILVETESLRGYLNERVDFLKLDIEGAEVDVLADCRDLLKNVRNLFVEYHSREGRAQRLGELLEILEVAGFRHYVRHVGVSSPHPYEQIRGFNGIDNQLNIFAFRPAAGVVAVVPNG